MVKLILLLSFWPILLIMYGVMRKEIKPGRGMLLGVSIPKGHMEDAEVAAIQKQCEKRLTWLTVFLSIAGLLIFLIPWMSVAMTFYMIWLFAGLAGLMRPFATGFNRLKALKREKGWYTGEGSAKPEKVEPEKYQEKSSWQKFLPPILISLVPAVYECIFAFGSPIYIPMISILAVMGSCTVLMWLCGFIMRRIRQETISTDKEVNQEYNRIRIEEFDRCFLQLAWINAVYTFIIWVYMEADRKQAAGGIWFVLFLCSTMIYTILLCGILFRTYAKIRKQQKEFMSRKDIQPVDDDENWIWGMIYYNPKDPHFLVNKRVGIGTTCNLATTGGKVMTGVGVAAILLSMVLCVFLIWDEFTPVGLRIEENRIEALHHKVEYGIELEQIDTVELLTGEAPKMTKMYGTGMDTLCKGVFSVEGYQDCKVCLNPQNESFIVLDTKDGKRYIFSGYDDEETQAIYKQILEMLNSQ